MRGIAATCGIDIAWPAFSSMARGTCQGAGRDAVLKNEAEHTVMKRVVAAVIVAGLAGAAACGPVQAQGRPDSLAMSCAQVQGLVRSRGAVILGTGPYIYDRIVVDRRFCAPLTDGTRPAWVRARDTGRCFAGYTCVPIQDAWPFGDF
jgi:hypothetical protein